MRVGIYKEGPEKEEEKFCLRLQQRGDAVMLNIVNVDGYLIRTILAVGSIEKLRGCYKDVSFVGLVVGTDDLAIIKIEEE